MPAALRGEVEKEKPLLREQVFQVAGCKEMLLNLNSCVDVGDCPTVKPVVNGAFGNVRELCDVLYGNAAARHFCFEI